MLSSKDSWVATIGEDCYLRIRWKLFIPTERKTNVFISYFQYTIWMNTWNFDSVQMMQIYKTNLLRDSHPFHEGVMAQVDLALLVGGEDLSVQLVLMYGQGLVHGLVLLGQQTVFVGSVRIILSGTQHLRELTFDLGLTFLLYFCHC